METTGTLAVTDHNLHPRLLMAASTWWPSSARLATALVRNGCTVSAICPSGHPLRYISGIEQIYGIGGLRSRSSLLAAIRAAKPDLIIPCDDRIVAQLHELFSLHSELRPLVAASLGGPGGFAITDSRSKLLDLAANLGIRVPRGAVVATDAEAQKMFAQFAPVAVIKMDGTNGGEGVRIVRSAWEAAAAFRSLRLGAGLLTAVQRLLIYGDPLAMWSWTRRRKAEITIQQYIPGSPANNMIACWRGEVLDEVSVESVSCKGLTGSANVVRVIDNPQFTRAAKLLAEHLSASGFFGLDFIIGQTDGEPYLIEMNPRCTQLGHLQFSERGDLADALCARITGRAVPQPAAPIRNDTIAFFPQAWKASTPGDSWYSSFQDVPWEEKSLVDYLMQEPWQDRRWQARLYRIVRGPKRSQVSAAGAAPTPTVGISPDS